jgi:hypothetical protein
MGNGVDLTTDPARFMSALKPGDVLLFDGVSPISALIKLAENRPVNHCAVFLGQREFAEVRGHKPAADRRSPPAVPAARSTDLEKLLDSAPHYERTITALRHVNATRGGASAVAACARDYVDAADTTYRYLSLIALMVPSFFRTYEKYFNARRSTERLAEMLRVVSQSILNVMEIEGDKPKESDSRRTFTCSEFVYRCFSEAAGDTDYSIHVAKPLGRWAGRGGGDRLAEAVEEADLRAQERRAAQRASTRDRTRQASRSRTGQGSRQLTPSAKGGLREPRARSSSRRSETVDGEGLVRFDSSFKTELITPDTVSGGQTRAWGVKKDIAVLASASVLDILKHNILHMKYKDVVTRTNEVVPEFVTPRDLWGSKSLAAVSVLHLPPAYETDLDTPHLG